MAKTEKTITRKSLLVDYFGDIIGEKDHKLSVNARDDGNSVHTCLLYCVSGFVLIYCYFWCENGNNLDKIICGNDLIYKLII